MENKGPTPLFMSMLDEFSKHVYEMEDDMSHFEKNETALVDYLNNVNFTSTVGLHLRRYMCDNFAEETDDGYTFTLSDGKVIKTGNYLDSNYKISEDELKEYTEIFLDVNKKFNTDSYGNLALDFSRAEARRMLQCESRCTRKKAFEISFALHMSVEHVNKFLTDILAVQSYNVHDPYEIIAFFCQSHEKYNCYAEYLRLKGIYDSTVKKDSTDEPEEYFSEYAYSQINLYVDTEEELFDFLDRSAANFNTYSRIVYREYTGMIDRLIYEGYCEADVKSLSLDTAEQRAALKAEACRKAVEAGKVGIAANTEQLAREIIDYIPRETREIVRNGVTVYTEDYIPVHGPGHRDQNTSLSGEFFRNTLIRDRIDDLIRHEKPIERKDLVFLYFYIFNHEIRNKDTYTSSDYYTFFNNCNSMLHRCRMSNLYVGNRFENLILLSLLSSNPIEMFNDILYNSFFE